MTEQEKVSRPEDPVARQYERWAYPAPCHDLAALPFDSPDLRYQNLKSSPRCSGPSGPTARTSRSWWPDAERSRQLVTLISSPRPGWWESTSAPPAWPTRKFSKKKHGLERLTLHLCRVEDAASLGATFDFIACEGVLHHLADPVAGLRALGGVLRRDGVIDLMVYAPYGRAGVYMFQDLFRLMGLGQRCATCRPSKTPWPVSARNIRCGATWPSPWI